MSRNAPLPAEPIVLAQPAQTQLSLQQALALSSQLQSQGRLQEAEAMLRQILQAQPNNAHALHLMGIIAHQVGKSELAIDLIGQAIKQNGRVALFHANLAEMQRQLKRIEAAIEHGKQAVALDPLMASAHSNLGIAYYDNKDFDKARSCQELALKLAPTLPSALNNMGSILHEQKENKAAIEYYRKAIAADPNNPEPLNNLGAVLVKEERPEEAQAVLATALRLNPRYGDAHCNMGFALNGLDQFDRALQHFNVALQMRPDYPEAWLGIAKAYQEKHLLPEAVNAALKAIELDPARSESYSILGSIYTEMGEPEQAAANFDRALSIEPDLCSALLGKGNHYMEMGEMEHAEQLFNRALEGTPGGELAARFFLTQVKKVRAGDENFAALITAAERIDELPREKATYLQFALGKSYDDTRDYARAIEHFKLGCALKRKTFNYDPSAQERVFDKIIEVFDRATLDRLRGNGFRSDIPVFVLGMPRSGTTLTEQIIASHPQAYGAGELRDLLGIAHRAPPSGNQPLFPDNLKNLTPEILAAWGADYVSGIQKKAPGAQRITDKMPSNFLALGLIHLMLPDAKIVHVMRNPADTCLSNFTRLFNSGQEQSYDLTEIGRYYRDYARLMQHWREVLPQNSFFEIKYEDLVADTETHARQLIAYCGLEWDDACLRFHETKRSIRTASVTQVRQPIYNSSVERWRNYGDALGPLLEALGDLA
ncbi:MAG: tetratricopeptide repeat protein [Nitrosomonadales bacterium]|nr:tetratricopeptide repeat protein [Nitrosomonadales bacterium]